MIDETAIPQGFKPYRLDDTFNDVVAPLYLKVVDGQPVIGMLVLEKHCNYGRFAHGGALMTFMDIALSGAVCNALGKYTSTPTISITFDFITAAKPGDWITAEILSVDMKRNMSFVSAVIDGPRGRVARVSGCFRLPDDINAYPGMDAVEYHKWRTEAG